MPRKGRPGPDPGGAAASGRGAGPTPGTDQRGGRRGAALTLAPSSGRSIGRILGRVGFGHFLHVAAHHVDRESESERRRTRPG